MGWANQLFEFFWRRNPPVKKDPTVKQGISISHKMSREEFVATLADLLDETVVNENEKPDRADIILITVTAAYYFNQKFRGTEKPTGRELFDDLYQQYLQEK